MKIIKYLSFIAVALLVLIGGLVAILNSIDLNQHKGTLEKQFTELIGREISIKGESELGVSLRPRILLRDVRLKNAPWGSQPDMLRIGEAELAVELIPLLLNKIEVRRLSINDLDVLVESNGEGLSNWALGDLKAKTEKTTDSEVSGLQTEIVLHDALLENCRVSYKKYDEKAMRLTLDKLAVKRIDGSFQQWSLVAKHNEIPLTIDGTTSYIHDLLAGRPFKSDLKGKLGNLDFALNGDLTLGKAQNNIGLNLEFSIQAPDLKYISKLTTTKLPQVGPVNLSGKVSDSDGFYLLRLDSEIADLKLSGDGRISQAFDGKGDKVNLVLKAPDLAQLGQLGSTEFPKVGPVEVKAELSAVKDGYKISGLDAKIDKSDIKGEVSILYQRNPMFIQAEISSNLLDLKPFQKLASGKNTLKTETKQKANTIKGERVFPDTPLPIDQLKILNTDIKYTVKKLESDSETLRNVKLALKLENGRLTLNPVQAQLEGGPIEGDVVFDASKQKMKPVLTLNLRSTALELGKFKELKKTMTGGNTKVNVQLKGSGNSIREIVAGLNGETVLDIGEAVLADGTLNLIGGDILDSLLGALAPTENKAPSAALECAVVRFEVKDGLALANKSIALKTRKTVMVGSGKIDLKTEKISFQISSHSRKTVGLDAGDLTRTVGLGGTLANPKPAIDLVGTSKTGATIGAAILTLGSSYLAQKLVEAAIADNNPCLTALGKAPQKAGKKKVKKTTSPKK
jgi:uncharacterized protein involved in outer membrane biogenesis